MLKHLFPFVLLSLFVLPILQTAEVATTTIATVTVDELKTAIEKINAEQFTDAATEYISFAQKQGDALIAAAAQLLAVSGLSEEDREAAAQTKYWGIVLRYGNSDDELNQHLEPFADSLQSFPECHDLYRMLKEIADEFDKQQAAEQKQFKELAKEKAKAKNNEPVNQLLRLVENMRDAALEELFAK